MSIEENIVLIIIAIAIDLFIGDPVYPFHPVRLIGHMIRFLEKLLQGLKLNNLLGGALLLILSPCIPLGLYLGIFHLAENQYIQWGINLFLYYSLISIKDLQDHAKRVYNALREGDIELARRRLSWIVGRDTEELQVSQVAQATVETMAESSSDGIISPIFWGVLLGPMGILGFKVINTLDSMVGYKNKKYLFFGRFSARADDVANFIPARITFSLFLLSTKITWKMVQCALSNRKNHSSPNSGHPEAAMAVLLNIRMGGPSKYGGVEVQKPYINNNGELATSEDIINAHKQIHLLSAKVLLLLVFIGIIFHFYS